MKTSVLPKDLPAVKSCQLHEEEQIHLYLLLIIYLDLYTFLFTFTVDRRSNHPQFAGHNIEKSGIQSEKEASSHKNYCSINTGLMKRHMIMPPITKMNVTIIHEAPKPYPAS